MLKKKFGVVTLVCLLCLCVAMLFTACGGTQGEKGDKGESGADGKDGVSIVSVEKTDSEGLTDTYTITYSDGKTTTFTVTNGKDGVDGSDGEDGTDGEHGISITDAELNESGELVLILSDGSKIPVGSVVGADGVDGQDGANGVGIAGATLEENGVLWLELTDKSKIEVGKVTGSDGADGKSAYDLYKEHHPEYTGDEEQWLYDLVNGNLAEVQTHTVTFDAAGGYPTPEAQKVKHLDKASKPESPKKTGYIFDGWYCGDEKWAFSGYIVTEDITLVAKWVLAEEEQTCAITSAVGFEFGSEIIDENPVQTISRKVANATESFNLAAVISVSKNCTWKLFSDYEQTNEISSKICSDLQTGDNISWLVVYGESEQELYKVTLYRRHIRNYTFMNEEQEHDSGTIEEDKTLTIPETPKKAGYTFQYWTVNGKQVAFPYTVTVDTTFHAVYTPNENTLHFNGYGATGGITEDMTIATDATATLIPNGFEKAGYHFIGWATSAGGEVEFTDEDSYPMGTESEYTLYAVWEANENTLHFDGNGATSGTTEDMTIATDETVTLIPNGFEKAGYHFIGWATSADGEVKFTDEDSYTMGTESEYTLYVVWEANINTLRFDKNDEKATGEMPSIQMKTDEVQNLPAVGFEKSGYHLKGWATSTDGEVEFANEGSYTMGTESEYTLYAVWEANENTLHFDGNGATSGTMEDMTITTHATATLIPNDFERVGYIYKGWATSKENADRQIVNYENEAVYTMGTESEYTLYAVWEVITYSITYELNGGQHTNPATFTVEDLPLAINAAKNEVNPKVWTKI